LEQRAARIFEPSLETKPEDVGITRRKALGESVRVSLAQALERNAILGRHLQ
jgi:Arc/MetJ family transcription regulator